MLDFFSLPDALELVLLLVEEPGRFRRAALRWHARYCAEVLDVGFEEAHAVLACLAGLAGRRPKPAAAALAELVDRRGLERESEVLIRWGSGASLGSAGFLRARILLDYLLDRDDLLDEHEALVLLDDLLSIPGLSCPGRRTNTVARERTRSYSVFVSSTISMHDVSLHSHR